MTQTISSSTSLTLLAC